MQQNAAPNATPANAPTSADLDKQRVTLILEINSLLLVQIEALQAAGKGGDVQSPATNSASDGDAAQQKKPSREYVEPLRRMQDLLRAKDARSDWATHLHCETTDSGDVVWLCDPNVFRFA